MNQREPDCQLPNLTLLYCLLCPPHTGCWTLEYLITHLTYTHGFTPAELDRTIISPVHDSPLPEHIAYSTLGRKYAESYLGRIPAGRNWSVI